MAPQHFARANGRLGRIGWFVSLWAASVGSLAIVGLVIRLALKGW